VTSKIPLHLLCVSSSFGSAVEFQSLIGII